jgi:competence ComEA-like helix-hairpin-helix protein
VTSLNRTEQLLLASLLIFFLAGSAFLAWQQQELESSLVGEGLPADVLPVAKDTTTESITKTDRVVSLRNATAMELQALPGIGPKLAAEIVRYREQHPFGKVEDMLEVSGIGPKRFEKIRDRVKLD